jgi:hypothetical protein
LRAIRFSSSDLKKNAAGREVTVKADAVERFCPARRMTLRR